MNDTLRAVRVSPPACPICGQPVAARHRPFCSRRCAEVDLGRWLGEHYRIPGEPVDPDGLDPGEDEERR